MAKIETLVDNFDDNSTSGAWTDSASGDGAIAEQNQRLEISMAGLSGGASRVSASTYDLVASSAYVKLVRVPNGGGLWPHIEFSLRDANGYGPAWWSDLGVSLIVKQFRDGGVSEPVSLTHSDTDHAWLRIREDSGQFIWETAPDASGAPGTWVERHREAVHGDVTETAVVAKMGLSAAATAGAVHFDGFNTTTSGGAGGAARAYYAALNGLR